MSNENEATEQETNHAPAGRVNALVIRAESTTDKHADCTRGFTQLSKAWYADANLKNSKYTDEVTAGFYHKDGGTTGEFTIRWQELCGKSVPELTAFDDGWHALFDFGDMLESMADADDKNVSADEFCLMLEHHGIKNMTKTEYV